MSRKVAYVSRHEKCRIGGKRARNEVVVLWIRRSPWRRRWLEQQALCLQQTNQSIDLIGGKTEFRPRQNTFVFLGDLSGEARRYLPYCTACKTRDSLPNGEISADTITFVSSTTRITFRQPAFPAGMRRFHRRSPPSSAYPDPSFWLLPKLAAATPARTERFPDNRAR